MKPFFKSFTVNGRAVLAVQHESDLNPVIQWFYQPERLCTCSITHEFEGDVAGFAKCADAFERIGQAEAEHVAALLDQTAADRAYEGER